MSAQIENSAMDTINQVFSEMIDEVLPEDVKEESDSSEDSQTSEGVEQTPEEDDDSNLDFGDMPNGEIRYAKLKDQNKELKKQLQDIKNDIEKLKTQQPAKDESEEETEDPTEYMSENEKLLYLQQQKLNKELESVTSKLQKFENKEINEANEKREESFVKNHPEFGKTNTKKDLASAVSKARDFFLDYFDDRPDLAPLVPMLKNGTLSLEQIYAAALAENGVKPKTTARLQDAGKVFGTGKTTSVSSRNKIDEDNDVDAAYAELADPYSENKDQALEVAVGDLVDDIAALMREQS